MLEKLAKLIKYLPSIEDKVSTHVHVVCDEESGTTVLRNPALSGQQIVISLPSAILSGGCDQMNGPYVLIIYALEKSATASGLPQETLNRYVSTVELLEKIYEVMVKDITSNEDGCPFLAGFQISEINATPEGNVFGGWNGYSLTITLS